MKTRLIFFLISALIYGCSVEEEVLPLKTQEFSIEVLNEDGLPKPGAEVYLYKSHDDLQMRHRAIRHTKTDEKGIAHFSNLNQENYYVHAFYVENNKLYDNESVGDVYIDQSPHKSDSKRFFIITGYKRPINPDWLKLKACWLMKYSTPLSVYEKADSSLKVSMPVFVDFYIHNRFINSTGPHQFYRTYLKPNESRAIALAEYLKAPNPSISCQLLQDKPLEIRIYEQDATGELHLKKEHRLNLASHLNNQAAAYPDRVSVDIEGIQLDLMLAWE